jgi:hypothetical protein
MAKEEIKIQQNAIGLRLTFNAGTDLTDTTSLILVLKNSAGKVEIALSPSNISNPATGEIFYLTQSGDLALKGKYKGQLIDNSTGRYLPSTVFSFEVVANL